MRHHPLETRGLVWQVWGPVFNNNITLCQELPRWRRGEEPTCQCGSVPGLGRSPGGGNGNPLQYSCLENPMDRGTCWATVHGVAESDMTEHARYIVPCGLVISCHASASFGVFAGRESGTHGFSRHDTNFISVPNLHIHTHLLSPADSHTHTHTPYLQLTQSLRCLQHVPRLLLCDCQKSAPLDSP